MPWVSCIPIKGTGPAQRVSAWLGLGPLEARLRLATALLEDPGGHTDGAKGFASHSLTSFKGIKALRCCLRGNSCTNW